MTAKLFKGAEYLITEVTKDDVFTPEDFTDEQKQIGETTEQFVPNEVVPHQEEIENHNFDLRGAADEKVRRARASHDRCPRGVRRSRTRQGDQHAGGGEDRPLPALFP